MPWLSGASSSASGVAMPGTPPIIDPLPMSEIAPDTQRDEQLAVRAERRRWVTLGISRRGDRGSRDRRLLRGTSRAPGAAGVAAPTTQCDRDHDRNDERHRREAHGRNAERSATAPSPPAEATSAAIAPAPPTSASSQRRLRRRPSRVASASQRRPRP